MKRILILFMVVLVADFSASSQIWKKVKDATDNVLENSTNSKLSKDEVAKGLKQALTIGVKKGVEKVSKVDGYFKNPEIKILMPNEAKKVENKLRALGQGKMVDDAIESMNRAAEDAANAAKTIFVNTIKELTLSDVMSILHGNDNAATVYLEKHTRNKLVLRFKPSIKKSLDKVGATKHWNSVFTFYNKLPFVKKINPNLEDYVTNKAIDGLFVQIAKKEKEIRKNPAARVTDLLKKVFK